VKIVIASNNAKKRKEINAILDSLGISIVAVDETVFVDVVEDGESFADNARKKAESFAYANRLPALADDSGLCVDALGGAPGVFSSRYAGADATDADNNAKLLGTMRGIKNRAAHFVCALHLAFPDERPPVVAQGAVDGVILHEADGDHGFGYDPIFFCTELNRSFAGATAAEKASVSHRGRALRALAEQLTGKISTIA